MIVNKNIKNNLKQKFRKFNGNYITIGMRPVKADKVKTKSHFIHNNKNIAIIIQGPIHLEDDFTVETVKLYMKIYPGIKIIVSTWKGIDESTVKKIEDLGIMVIKSQIPQVVNGSNISREIVSTMAGLLKAKELGCEYVCKTRSDQRLYAPDLFEYFLTLIKMYPLTEKSNAKGRIITSGRNTYWNRLYDVNDMWNFGYIEDMINYWNCELDGKGNLTDNEFNKMDEVYEAVICANYIKKLGYELKFTIEDSIQFYAKLFIIVDLESLDLYWIKRRKEYFNRRYESNKLDEFSHRHWLVLQNINDDEKNIIVRNYGRD